MLEKMKNLVLEEEGQGLTEYGLILAAIVVVAVTVIALLGPAIEAKFDEIIADIEG